MTSIGELGGVVSLEDRFSSALDLVASKAKRAIEGIKGDFATLALTVTSVAAVIAGVAGTIVGLGIKGSQLNDLDAGFEHLAGSAAKADEILQAMTKGVENTVDSTDLLRFANQALSRGAITTAKDFGTVTTAARALSREGFGPIPDIMERISAAMTSGNTRSLQYLTGVIDLKKAETEYAKSIGTTRDQLSRSGQVHAAQIAIIDRLNQKVAESGNLQKSFAERVTSARLSIGNWFDDIAKQVAASASVNKAFDAIGDSIVKNFGGTATTVLDTIVRWVNKFADAAAYYGPIVVEWLRKAVDWVTNLYNWVLDAWSTIPDWFKNIAKEAALAGGAIYLTSKAIGAMTGGGDASSLLSTVASFATITSGSRDLITALGELSPAFAKGAAAVVAYWDKLQVLYRLGGLKIVFGSITDSVLSFGAALLASPFTVTVLFTALAAAIWQVAKAIQAAIDWWKSGKPMWDFFAQKDDDNFVRRWLGLSKGIDSVADSMKRLGDQRKGLEGLMTSRSGTGPGNLGTVPGDGLPAGPRTQDDIDQQAQKVADATKASIDRTTRMWDEYFSSNEKRSGNELAAKLGDIQRWYDGEMATLDKSKQLNANYWNERIALVELFSEKQEAAIQESVEKSIDASRKLSEEGIGAVVKGLAGQPDVLRNMATAMAEFTNETDTSVDAVHDLVSGLLLARRSIPNMSAIGTLAPNTTNDANVKNAGALIAASMDSAFKATQPVSAEVARLAKSLYDLGYSAEDIGSIFGISMDQAVRAIGRGRVAIDTVLSSIKQFPMILAQAFTGGGGIGGAFKSLFTGITADLFGDKGPLANITKGLSDKLGGFLSKGLGSMLGKALGEGISSLLPGVGALLAPLLDKIGSALKDAFGGPSKAELAGRDVEAKFEGQFKNFEDMANSVGRAYATTGLTLEQARADLDALLKAEKEGPEAVQKIIDKLQGALDKAKQIDDAINGLGIKSKDEWTAAADIANQAYKKVAAGVETGKYTVEDAVKAYRAYQQVLADSGDAAAKLWLETNKIPVSMSEAVEAAGYKTKAQLEAAAQQAEELFTYMRDSGQFTADQIGDAYEKMLDAQNKALGRSGKEFEKIKSRLEELNKGIEAEAWEPEMGSTEKKMREERDRLQKQFDSWPAKADEVGQTVSTAIDKASDVASDKFATAGGEFSRKLMTGVTSGEETFTASAGRVGDAYSIAGDTAASKMTSAFTMSATVTTTEFKTAAAGVQNDFFVAADATTTKFSDSASQMKDGFISSARDAARDIGAIFDGVSIVIPIVWDIEGMPTFSKNFEAPEPDPTKMAFGTKGVQYASGPMTISTQGNEYFWFSGEGNTTNNAPPMSSGVGPITIPVYIGGKLVKEIVIDELETSPSTRDARVLKSVQRIPS